MALKVVITKLRPVTGWCLFDRMSRIARFLYHPLLDSLYIINAACRILVLLCCWWCRRNYRDVKRAVHNIKTHSSAHQSAVSNHPWMPWPNLLNLARIYIVLYNNISTGVLPSTALYLCTASYLHSVCVIVIFSLFISLPLPQDTLLTRNFAESAFSERIYTLYSNNIYRRLSELITDVIKLYDFIIIISRFRSCSRFSFKLLSYNSNQIFLLELYNSFRVPLMRVNICWLSQFFEIK